MLRQELAGPQKKNVFLLHSSNAVTWGKGKELEGPLKTRESKGPSLVGLSGRENEIIRIRESCMVTHAFAWHL